MTWNRIKLGFWLALIYWTPATLVLLNIMYGAGPTFSLEIDMFLMPGYFIGFALGFAGGKGLGILGQIISLLILTLIMLVITSLFPKKETNKEHC